MYSCSRTRPETHLEISARTVRPFHPASICAETPSQASVSQSKDSVRTAGKNERGGWVVAVAMEVPGHWDDGKSRRSIASHREKEQDTGVNSTRGRGERVEADSTGGGWRQETGGPMIPKKIKVSACHDRLTRKV
jgi:hypothetical protein